MDILLDNSTILTRNLTAVESAQARTIPGAGWDPHKRGYRLPLTESSVQAIKSKWPDKYLDTEILQGLAKREAALTQAQAVKELSFTGNGLMPVSGAAYTHQRSAYETALALMPDGGGCGLWHEMGTGKTLTCIALIGALTPARALIIAPVSVVSVWGKELAHWAEYEHSYNALEGSAKKRLATIDAHADNPAPNIFATNYEILGRNKDITERLMDWQPEMIICDEAHRLKNPASKQSKQIGRLGQVAKWRIAATGTPVSNKTEDIFGIFKWLDPSVFGTSFPAFKNRYCIQVPAPHGGKMVVGMKPDMLPELSEKMHSIAHRVSKEEALDLPPESAVPVEVELEPKARKVYDQLVADSIAFLEGEAVVAPHILTRMLRLQQLTGGFVESVEGTLTQISAAKQQALMDLLEAATGKVVVFARFTREIGVIEEACRKLGLDAEKIDGSIPMSERGEIVDRFQSGDTQVFIGQTEAASEGITLHAADTAIFYSKTLSLSKDDQAKSRIHRSGQVRPVTFYNITAVDTIDEKIVQGLESKKDMATLVTDNWRSLLG